MDPDTLQWTPGPALPWPCETLTGIHLLDDRLYLIGLCGGATVYGVWSLNLDGSDVQQESARFTDYPQFRLRLVPVPRELFQNYKCG